MRISRTIVVAVAVAALTLGASTQANRRVARPATGENALVGVRLYDSGTRVIQLFGTPNEIQAILFSASNAGGGGGSGAPGPGGPAGGGSRGGGGTGAGGQAQSAGVGFNVPEIIGDPFNMGAQNIRQGAGATPPPPSVPEGSAPPGRGPGGTGGQLSMNNQGGGGGGNRAPGNAPTVNAGPMERTEFTRWVYNRGSAKYGFVLDNRMRVVQIEAIGLNDRRVRTRRGIGFGATFGQIIRAYNAPDSYDVGGDNLMVRYLQRHKVAFRLNRLAPNRPHQVTGVVVAAARS